MHPVFGEIACRMTCIDSGGHYTTDVYKFTQTIGRVVAIKGVTGTGKPMVGKPTRSNLAGIQLFPLGVDTLKETVVSRLRVSNPDDPGYCAFPADRGQAYFQGLTAETLMTRLVKGFKKSEWVKVRPRNEPFDLRVYATAALEMLQIDLGAQRRAALRAAMRRVNKQVISAAPAKASKPVGKAKSAVSWADRWRND
jgi:phage terminase large subunit GpA-like protein